MLVSYTGHRDRRVSAQRRRFLDSNHRDLISIESLFDFEVPYSGLNIRVEMKDFLYPACWRWDI